MRKYDVEIENHVSNFENVKEYDATGMYHAAFQAGIEHGYAHLQHALEYTPAGMFLTDEFWDKLIKGAVELVRDEYFVVVFHADNI